MLLSLWSEHFQLLIIMLFIFHNSYAIFQEIIFTFFCQPTPVNDNMDSGTVLGTIVDYNED